MIKIQLTIIFATLIKYICSQNYDAGFPVKTVNEQGQPVITVPVFLLSQKQQEKSLSEQSYNGPQPPPSYRQVPRGRNLPLGFPRIQQQRPPSQMFSQSTSAHNTYPQPPPLRNSVISNNRENIRNSYQPQPPPQYKPLNNFNKPHSQFNHHSSPSYQTNYLKVTNSNSPTYHKPVPPPLNVNKIRQPSTTYEKPPGQTLYTAYPSTNSHNKPPSQSRRSQTRPNYQSSYVQTSQQLRSNYKPSQSYVNPPTTYTINTPSSSYSSSIQQSSYSSLSEQSYSAPSSSHSYAGSSRYNNPQSTYISQSSEPSANNYGNSDYGSHGGYSHNTFSRPATKYSSSNYNTRTVHNPSPPESSTYIIEQPAYNSEVSKENEYREPSSETSLYEIPDVKTSETSSPIETDEVRDENTTVNYKVIYIPLEVLKSILSHGELN